MIVKSPFTKRIEIESCDSLLINTLVKDANDVLDDLTKFNETLNLDQLFQSIKNKNEKTKTRISQSTYYQIVSSDLLINFRIEKLATHIIVESISYINFKTNLNIRIHYRKTTMRNSHVISLSRRDAGRVKDLLLGVDYIANKVSAEYTAHPDPKIHKFMTKNYSSWPIVDEHEIVHAKMSI